MGEEPVGSSEVLREIVRRIVEVARPERIILFGSAARGDLERARDIDLLVIKRGEFHRGRLTEEIYMRLLGVGVAVDIVVATEDDVQRYGQSFALVIGPAVREGKVIYAA